MIDTPLIIVISVMVFLYGLFSQLLERTAITAPMVFLSVGVLLGPAGVALLNIDIDTAIVRIVAELTLIIILFVDASLINWTSLRSITGSIPVRLLAVGLPLTMIVGSLIGYALFSDLGIWPIVLMAVILSPTDVALGQAVTGSPVVPRPFKEMALSPHSAPVSFWESKIERLYLASNSMGWHRANFWNTGYS